jgi:hypothetical protein
MPPRANHTLRHILPSWRRWRSRPVGILTGAEPTKPPPPDPVCICVPLVGSDGKLIPQPSPDCPIAGHSQLARDLIAAAQEGRGDHKGRRQAIRRAPVAPFDAGRCPVAGITLRGCTGSAAGF